MQKIFVLTILSVVLSSSMGGAHAAETERAVVFTPENFESEVKKYSKILVQMYTTDSQDNKIASSTKEKQSTTTPEKVQEKQNLFHAVWDEVTQELTEKQQNPPVYLGKVNLTSSPELQQKYEVYTFAAMYWYEDGVEQQYNGGKKKEQIVDWVIKKMTPLSKQIECDGVQGAVSNSKTSSMIAYFGDVNAKLYKNAYLGYAKSPVPALNHNRDSFFHADLSCQEKFDLSGDSKIVLFQDFGKKVHVFAGAEKTDSLVSFIKMKLKPTVFELANGIWASMIFSSKSDTLALFLSPDDQTPAYLNTFKEAAAAHEDKALFTYTAKDQGVHSKLRKLAGAEDVGQPMLAFLRTSKSANQIYHCQIPVQDLTVETIGTFIQKVLDGGHPMYVRSAKPVDNTGKSRIDVVADNFNEIVMDSSKDVLVNYYHPKNQNTKPAQETWQELADFFNDSTDLVIAQYDALNNDVADKKIFDKITTPKTVLYGKNNKGKLYNGPTDLENMKEFIYTESSVVTKPANTEQQADL